MRSQFSVAVPLFPFPLLFVSPILFLFEPPFFSWVPPPQSTSSDKVGEPFFFFSAVVYISGFRAPGSLIAALHRDPLSPFFPVSFYIWSQFFFVERRAFFCTSRVVNSSVRAFSHRVGAPRHSPFFPPLLQPPRFFPLKLLSSALSGTRRLLASHFYTYLKSCFKSLKRALLFPHVTACPLFF